MLGKTLAHYEIEECLGEGGSGVVYCGRDLRLERPVAIKVLAEALRDDELAWGRLLREARLASQLSHPNIAAIYDLGEEDGCAYIVMEYVRGLPLADLIPEGGMPLGQLQRYAGQIAEALDFAHQQGVIHGDLKGSNIIITAEGNIKLLDFGLARRIPRDGMTQVTTSHLPLAEAGAAAGTLPYLAPEVLRGQAPGGKSDIWALGVLLYQMATGDLPFRGTTPFELCMEIMVGTPPDLEQLPEPLQSALRQALEKDPASRFRQAREISTALASDKGMIEAAPPAVRGDTATAVVAEPTAPQHPRKWWAAGAGVVLCLLLLGGAYAHYVRGVRQSVAVASGSKSSDPTAAEDPDLKVWVNTDSGTYHCPGTRWYGKTQAGQFMTQKQARGEGYHPALSHACM